MSSYQTLYQNQAVDLMNKKIILETTNFSALLSQLGISFGSIASETVGQTIQNRVGLNEEQLRCLYGWSSEFTSFLFGMSWANVSSFVFVLSTRLGLFIGLLWHYYILHQQCVVSIDGILSWLLT